MDAKGSSNSVGEGVGSSSGIEVLDGPLESDLSLDNISWFDGEFTIVGNPHFKNSLFWMVDVLSANSLVDWSD